MQKAKHKSIKTLVVCLRQNKTRSIHVFRRSRKFTAIVIQKWTLHSPQGRSAWKSYSFKSFWWKWNGRSDPTTNTIKGALHCQWYLESWCPQGEDDWGDTGSGCKDRCCWEAEKRPEAKLGRVQGEKVQLWSWQQFRLQALFTHSVSDGLMAIPSGSFCKFRIRRNGPKTSLMPGRRFCQFWSW